VSSQKDVGHDQHPRLRYNPSAWRRPWRDRPRIGRILLQAQMTAILVIIGNEFTHQSLKQRLVKDNDFVQQLSA
jgi:hypothetical protein